MLDYADPLSSLQSQHVNNLKWLLQRFLTERPPAGTSTANTNTTDDWTEMAHQTLFLLIQCTHATSLQKDTWKLILHALKSPNTQDANDKLRGFMVKTAMDRSDRDFVREWMVHHVYLDRIGEGFSRMEGCDLALRLV